MSRFYGTMRANHRKTLATTRGHRDGILAHIRGWNFGIEVNCWVDENNKEHYTVTKTGGSNNDSQKELIYSTVKEVAK